MAQRLKLYLLKSLRELLGRPIEELLDERYAKLEEPLIVDKVVRIRDRVGNAVGILEGWGGYYMLEAIPADTLPARIATVAAS